LYNLTIVIEEHYLTNSFAGLNAVHLYNSVCSCYFSFTALAVNGNKRAVLSDIV